jgi:hypothetical protein
MSRSSSVISWTLPAGSDAFNAQVGSTITVPGNGGKTPMLFASVNAQITDADVSVVFVLEGSPDGTKWIQIASTTAFTNSGLQSLPTTLGVANQSSLLSQFPFEGALRFEFLRVRAVQGATSRDAATTFTLWVTY